MDKSTPHSYSLHIIPLLLKLLSSANFSRSLLGVLSPFSTVYMYRQVGPSTRAWVGSQGLHLWRKNDSLTAAINFQGLVSKGWVFLTPPPTHTVYTGILALFTLHQSCACSMIEKSCLELTTPLDWTCSL